MKGLKNKQRKGKKLWYDPYADMIKFCGGLVGALLWLKPKVHRVSNNAPRRIRGGAVIAPNHISRRDPLVIFCAFWYRRLSFLVAKELYLKPINRFFFSHMNCIPVDREGISTGALRTIRQRLLQRQAVVIFPEGTINRETNAPAEYKMGAVFSAYKSECPILPVYIGYDEKRSHVVIGEAVDILSLCASVDGTKQQKLEYACRYLHDCELELKEYYENEIIGGKNERKENIASCI